VLKRKTIGFILIGVLAAIALTIIYSMPESEEHTHESNSSSTVSFASFDSTKHEHLYTDFLNSFNEDPQSPIVCYRKNHRNFYVIIFILVVLLLLFISFSFVKIKRLNKIVHEQNTLLKDKHHELEIVHQELDDSIDYAKNIHNIVLPFTELKTHLPESFIFHASSHKIGGDFYWCSKKNNLTIVGVVDCTGHGVPGALLSMISFNLIGEVLATETCSSPKEMLDQLNEKFNAVFHQGEHQLNDGLDISMCFIDSSKKKIQFSGAGSQLLYEVGGVVHEIKGVAKGIGHFEFKEIAYENHQIPYEQNATYYLFSDGYPDQFGGEHSKKFGKRRMKSLLEQLANTSIQEKGTTIENEFTNWKGANAQTDDVTVLGFCLKE